MLIKKNVDQNVAPDRGGLLFTELGTKFTDKYGDRSGIKVWSFDADRKIWMIRRNSGNVEYYKKLADFKLLTKIDLKELAAAPFFNPSNHQGAMDFKLFLERKAKKNFKEIKVATSFVKKACGVLAP